MKEPLNQRVRGNTNSSNKVPFRNEKNASFEDIERKIKNTQTYDMAKILIVNIIQSASYFVVYEFRILRAEKILYWPEVAFGVSAHFLLMVIRGYDGKYYYSNFCRFFLFLIIFAFKVYFFIYIYYIVELLDLKYIFFKRSESTKTSG